MTTYRLSLLHCFTFLASAVAAVAADAAKPVFETPKITSTTQPRLLDVKVPLDGAKELFLVVTDEGANSGDWADWIEPKLIIADGTTTDLSTLKWKSASSGAGNANIGRNAMGGPLLVDGKTFANGVADTPPASTSGEARGASGWSTRLECGSRRLAANTSVRAGHEKRP